MAAIMDGDASHHKLCISIAIVQLQLLKSQSFDNKFDCNCRYNFGGNLNRKYGASHTGLVVSEGVSRHLTLVSFSLNIALRPSTLIFKNKGFFKRFWFLK